MICVIEGKVLEKESKTRSDNTTYGVITVYSGKEVINILDKEFVCFDDYSTNDVFNERCIRSHSKYGECLSICK